MRVTGYPECCGALIVQGFYNDEDEADEAQYDDDEISSFKSQLEQSIKKYTPSAAFLTLILNENQDDQLKGMIKDLGFNQVAGGYNKGSGNNIYQYTLILNKVVT